MSVSQSKKNLQIPIDSYNFANNTKWIFNIPVGHLFHRKTSEVDGQILEYPLNCKSIQFPDFKIGTTKAQYFGYGFDISTRQNLTEKGLNVEFLVSSNWLQYLLLLKWFELEDYTRYNKNRTEETQTVDIGNVTPTIDDSNFKTPGQTRNRSILFYTRTNCTM